MDKEIIWKPFKISEIAEISSGRDIYGYERVDGKTPYLSASASNNGIGDYVSNVNETLESDCISVNRNGSVGYAFYHPYEALYSNDVRKIRLNKKSDELLPLFICTSLRCQKENYSYSRKMGTKRLLNQRIMLPVNEYHEPDYHLIEKYVRERETELLGQYLTYARQRLTECEFFMKGDFALSVKDREWREFFIGDIFSVSRPNARTKGEYSDGDIPFIASGAVNNGVIKCCTPRIDEVLDDGNCITVSPVDGSAFYQETSFLGRGGAGSSILILRSENLTKERGLFLSKAIQHTCSKYTYGRMGNKDGIKRERILLPVTNLGNPDYEFMEQYVRERERGVCCSPISLTSRATT